MVHSLQFRLILAFSAVILLTVGLSMFFVGRTAGGEIREWDDRQEQAVVIRMERFLFGFYGENEGWEGIQPYVEQMASMRNQRIILTDDTGRVVADSDGVLIDKTYQPRNPGRIILSPQRVPLGTLYMVDEAVLEEEISAQNLHATIISYILWGALMAVAIAVLLTVVLSRRILAPVRALTFAARQLGRGEFPQRVHTSDKGELGELARTFNTMASDLEKSEKAHRGLVADVAHELRTPLTNIKGYLEAVADGVIQPDTPTIAILQEETEQLAHLIDDLQELSMADAGKLRLAMQPEDISQLITHSVTSARVQSEEKGIRIDVQMDELPSVMADSRRILEVLHNLLVNAIRHTPRDGHIYVSASENNGFVQVSIRDTGTGIEEEDLKHIFERFYRADKSRTRATGGSGLGLTISKRLIEAHKGTITATSTPGDGACFTFTVPIAK